MALVATIISRIPMGNKVKVIGTLAFDSSYPTGGESLSCGALGLSRFESLTVNSEGGYTFDPEISSDTLSATVKAYSGASGTTGATSGGTPAAQTFIGTAPLGDLNIATPAFSGTGQSSSGQVITTTDNQTMTLNQCAGMWFVSATHGPYLIASNTAVSGAPAVLTTYGTAPTTDAGTYKILKALAAVGTNTASAALATHTHTVGAAAGGEVADTTDLSALTAVEFEANGC